MTTRSSRHRRSASRPSVSRPRAFGFTLVEMLIAMVLTLIMVYAIAEFYAYVGETVKDGRALIEIRSSMRTALQRLKDDLDHLTVKVTPPVEDGKAQGYLCLWEGICNDASPIPGSVGAIDADGTGGPDIGQDLDGDGIADYLDDAINATNLLGDTDDVLAFTIRNDVDPFTAPAALLDVATGEATGGSSIQSSSIAEVAWWTSFTDNPTFATAGGWDLGEPKNLHRRLLLVRPDVNLVHASDPNGYTTQPYYLRIAGASSVGEAYYRLMQISDVSVRPFTVTGSSDVYFMANSLADLTRRENRYMSSQIGDATAFPNALDLNPHFAGTMSANPWDAANNGSLYRWLLNSEPLSGSNRRGEDVMLSNILAFDMRVFDPTAILLAGDTTPANASVALQPGDPGYNIAKTANVSSSDAQYTRMGQGAYVDLNYGRYVPGPWTAQWSSYFSGASSGKSRLGVAAVYDTWATSYERDGLNQDLADDAGETHVDGAATPLTDEGTDGLDSETTGRNGVDDSGERETLPPYPVPLRGIEIKLRVYEPGTRQAQQATVGADFVAE